MSDFKEFTEAPEFVQATLPILTPMPTNEGWDGWGDEQDKLQFEKRHPLVMQLGEIAVSGNAQPSVEDDGWGVGPISNQ